MAYVMNPNNFKLGYSLTWSDNWYSNNKLYPLMLHIMLNIRSLIGYFFYNKRIEKINIYLSHMNLGLTSGCLYISLFFYDTRIDYRAMNYSLKLYQYSLTPQTYRNHYKFYRKKMWKNTNPSTMFNYHLRDMFMRYPWWNEQLGFRPETESEFQAIYKSQNFFLFFEYLGLAPDILLLEYYQRNYFRFRRYLINRIINKKRLYSSNKWMYICARETFILSFFYKFLLNDKLKFDWLNNSKDNSVLHFTRILRYLFFYSRMPHWNRRHLTVTLPRENKYIQNYIKSLSLRKTNKEYLRYGLYNKFLKTRKKNRIKLKKKIRKKRIKNLLSSMFVKLFLGKVIRNNKNIFKLELSKVKTPSYMKSSKLKKKYKLLLKNVNSLVKRSNFLSFLFYFNLIDQTYKDAVGRVNILKKHSFYNQYKNLEGLKIQLKFVKKHRVELEKADTQVLSDIDTYVHEYFKLYYKFLPYFSFLDDYKEEKLKWQKFLLAYNSLYSRNYKLFFRNLRNNNKEIAIKEKLKNRFFEKHEKKLLTKFFKKKEKSFYNKTPNLLKKSDIDYLNKMKLSIKFLKREKDKKKKEEEERQRKLRIQEKLKKEREAKLGSDREQVLSLFKVLFEKLKKQKNYQAYWKYSKRRTLSATVHYGFDIYKFFSKRFMYIKSTTQEKMRSEFKTMHVVRFSYARLFFMLWILNLNTQFKKMAPYRLTQEGYYKRLSIYESIYLFYFILIKRPFLKKFSTYIGLLIKKWLGLNSKFNFYIITNNEITSSYIARHIAHAFKLGFDWRNVVRPIKKDLNFLLTKLRVLDYGTKSTTYKSFKDWIVKDNKNFFSNSEVFFKMYKKRYIGYILQSFKYKKAKIFFFLFWKNKFLTKKYKAAKLRSYFFLAKRKRSPVIDHMFLKKYLKLYLWNISYFMEILKKLKIYSYYYFKFNYIRSIFYPTTFKLKKKNVTFSPLKRNVFPNVSKSLIGYNEMKWYLWRYLFELEDEVYKFSLKEKRRYDDNYGLTCSNHYMQTIFGYLKYEVHMEWDLSRVWKICLNKFKLIYYFFLFRYAPVYFTLSKLTMEEFEEDFDSFHYVKIVLEFYSKYLSYFDKFISIYINLKKLNKFKLNKINIKKKMFKYLTYILDKTDTHLKRYRLFATQLVFLVKTESFNIKNSLIMWKSFGIKPWVVWKKNFYYNNINYLKVSFDNKIKGFILVLILILDKKLNPIKEKFIEENFFLKLFFNDWFATDLDIRISKWINQKEKSYYIWLNSKNFFNAKNTRYLFMNLNKYVYFKDINLDVYLSIKKHHRNLMQSVSYKNLRWNKSSNLLKKKTYIDYFFKNKAILGYKFRLAGRFRRRRKRSIVWIKKGLLPIASHEKLVDYGQSITANEYSTFSVRIWIHRNQNFTHKYFLKF